MAQMLLGGAFVYMVPPYNYWNKSCAFRKAYMATHRGL